MVEVCDGDAGETLVGYYVPDLVVGDAVVVELKALGGLDSSHVAQIIGYLAIIGCAVGLLVNFGRRSLEWRRILPPRDLAKHQPNREWLFVPRRLNRSENR